MSSAAINPPHTRAAAASLDQKASGLIGALTPKVPKPEWTSLEHARPLQERGSAASVCEELSLWSGPRMQAVLGVIKQAAPIDVTVLVRVRPAPARSSSHGLCIIWAPAMTGFVKVNYATHKIKDAALDRNRRATDRP